MPTSRVLRALLAWWPVVIGGMAATLVAGLLATTRSEGVYWAEISVVFLPPTGPTPGNVLEGYSASLIHFAGAVEREVNSGSRAPRLSSPNATLYGAGVRDGSSVTLVDEGGQWESEFNRAALIVEVVAPTADEVRNRSAALVTQIDRTAMTLQRDAGVDADRLITVTVAPEEPSVRYIEGSAKRALVAIVLLGAGGTVAGVLVAEERRPRARRAAFHEVLAHV